MFLPDGMQASVVRPESDCRTPNFDRLAQRGIRFNRAHTPLPTCSPARASLMTGLLPHNHGVLQVEHCVDDDQCILRTEHPHWAQRLSESGYRTGYFGKWHIERTNRLEEFGWQVNGCDEGAAFRALGEGVASKEQLLKEHSLAKYKEGPEGYNRVLHYGVTEVPPDQRGLSVTTGLAEEFVSESSGKEAPWACCVSFPEPNVPVVAGREAFEQYDVTSITLPENLRDDFKNSPAFYRRQREILEHISDDEWREALAVYYALITELDAQFGRLMDRLEETGQIENTVVIAVSDHGRYMGSHGFDCHNFGAFEEAYNIPLIMAGPGIARGQVTDANVSLHDLCPTLIELAEAESIGAPDSKSFASLLSDPETQAQNFRRSYAEFYGTRYLMTQRILWEGPWKFVFNGFDYDELYNLDSDPHELNNLGGRPEYQERMKSMMAAMWHIMKETGDRILLETHYSPMRFALVGPNAERR